MNQDQLACYLRRVHEAQQAAPIGLLDGWTFASDGYLLVGIEGDLGLGEFKGPKSAVPLCRDLIGTDSGTAIHMAALREFAGFKPVPLTADCDECEDGLVVCQECHGEEVTCVCNNCDDEHETECAECDGKGREPCCTCGPRSGYPKAYGRIAGTIYNLNLLCNLLACAPDEGALSFRKSKTPAGDECMVLAAPGFRGVLMPVREDGVTKYRSFDVAVPA